MSPFLRIVERGGVRYYLSNLHVMVPPTGILCRRKYGIGVQRTPPIGLYKLLGPQVHLPADCSFVTRPLHLPNLGHLPNQ